MAAGEAVEEVKAVIERAIEKRFGEVGVVPSVGGLAVGVAISESEMPFSNHAGGVAIVAEEFGERGAFTFDQRIAVDSEENPAFEVRAPAVASGEKSVATGSAATRWGMGIGETNAVGCQFLESGRVELCVVGIFGPGLVCGSVAHAHVIGEENDNVGWLRLRQGFGGQGCCER